MNRVLTFYESACCIMEGKMPVPRMAIFYPTYGCNLNCEGCMFRKQNKKPVYADWDRIKDAFVKMAQMGVKSVEICGGGEPLIHPRIKEIITYFKDVCKFDIGLLTNGVTIKADLMEFLLERCEYIRISVYSDTIDRIIPIIQQMLRVKKERSLKTRISGKLLASKKNKQLLPEQFARIASTGVEVFVKAERNTENGLSDGESKEIMEQLCMRELDTSNVNLYKSHLSCKCWLSPIHTLIDPKGEVYICCYFDGREGTHSLGNIMEESFQDIWTSEKHKEIIRKIDSRLCNIYDCRWHQYNKDMKEYLNNQKIQHKFC